MSNAELQAIAVEAQRIDHPMAKDLTSRQEVFARSYAEGLPAIDAYLSAFETTSSRASARVSAFRLLRNPKVAARVKQLQSEAAKRATRSAEALIAELEEMVEADIGELVRLDMRPCAQCWPEGQGAGREPNPDCIGCDGAGEPKVRFASTSDVSPGARRLLRGIEMFPDGSVKRVLLHSQLEARIELHRLKGMHIDRSVSLNLNADLKPLPKGMSVEEALAIMESVCPTTDALPPPVSEQ